MNSLRPMARSLLAVLLVFSWVTLSAFDVLEDLEVLVPLEIHSAAPIEESPPDAARTGQLANNILEWGNRIERPYNALFELPSFELPVFLIQETSRYAAKLHKLHCVFLI